MHAVLPYYHRKLSEIIVKTPDVKYDGYRQPRFSFRFIRSAISALVHYLIIKTLQLGIAKTIDTLPFPEFFEHGMKVG